MNVSVWDVDRRSSVRFGPALLLSLGGLAVGTLLAYAGVRPAIAFAVLGLGALILWKLPAETNVLWYAATLAIQVFQGLVAFRVAISDLFMLPAIRKTGSVGLHAAVVRSTLRRPLALLLVALLLGTGIGALEMGRVTGYALVNKDAGIVYLVAGFFAIAHYLDDARSIERLSRWFVLGVAAANITSLGGALLAFSGVPNPLYLTGNMRLYGWMMNPNLFGSIILTAALFELGALSGPRASLFGNGLRWANLWLFAVGLVLTLSRGTWLAAGAGAGVLLLLRIVPVDRPSWTRLAAAAAWLAVPVIALAVLTVVARGTAVAPPSALSAEEYAERLRQRFVDTCRQDPDFQICDSVQMPTQQPGSTGVAPALPALLPTPQGDHISATRAATSLTNSRGLDDRLAILGVAWREYTRSARRMLLGIGLGTFYATSAQAFGIPLIIHNTFAWFLVEMGPLGLAAVLWIWTATSRSLWRIYLATDWRHELAPGLISGFVALTVFCLLNEGFYQRHLWLLFVLADRLGGDALAQAPPSA